MSGRRPVDRAPRRAPPSDPAAGAPDAFDRWLSDGLAPDANDRAAGRRLADAWRDRRRAFDRAAASGTLGHARRRVWWWAPLTVAAIAAVAVVVWPTPIVVDDAALAGAYLDAMGALSGGAP